MSKITAMRMKMLCKQVKASDGITTDYSKVRGHTKGLDGSEVKGSVAAIHFFLTSSAKYNLDSEILLAEIQQLGLPKDASEALVQHYSDSKQEIQQSLERARFRKSKLNDVSWRVDHVVACSDSEKNKNELETQVQLILNMDPNPHLSVDDPAKCSKNTHFAVEMTCEKFEILYQELSEAKRLMSNLKN